MADEKLSGVAVTDGPKDARGDAQTSAGVWTAMINAFFATVQGLPTAVRALVVLTVIAVAGFILYKRFVPASPSAANPVAAYTGGIADPTHPGADSANPQNIEAADKASEDEMAVQWHLLSHQSDDNPQETPIDPERQLSYRYFSKSDHCIFVRRRIGDHDVTQWVKDPDYHLHDVHPNVPGTRHAQLEHRQGIDIAVARSLTSFAAVVSAETIGEDDRRMAAAAPMCPNPINPHPGQFRYWWGAPVDQCNSPMYRQFLADGCTHYQIYNRCANAWDSRIFWTSCAAQHRW